MKKATHRKNQNRTIFINFHTKVKYHQLCQDGSAFIEFVTDFIISLGFQLRHKPGCTSEKICLTRHSHYERVRLGNLQIWRVQCTDCDAVFTVLPHFVLRYLSLSPGKAKKALLTTHGGLSLENCHLTFGPSAMCFYRLVCSFGREGLVPALIKSGLTPPAYFIADEKHSHCQGEKVYLPTIVTGRVIWHLGYTTSKDADKFTASYATFKDDVEKIDPSYQPKGVLTDGFESTRKSLLSLFPKIKLGNCLGHAIQKIPGKLQQTTTPIRLSLQQQFQKIFFQPKAQGLLPVFSLGQKLRRFVEAIKKLTNNDNAERIKQWVEEKKNGWYILFQNPKIPKTSTSLDQAHNYLNRKLFNMKGFHHPSGSQKHFLHGLALMYSIIPYQRRAKNSHLCGIEVQGGKLPTKDWFLNLRIITAGGFT
jgi:hypothetical protein